MNAPYNWKAYANKFCMTNLKRLRLLGQVLTGTRLQVWVSTPYGTCIKCNAQRSSFEEPLRTASLAASVIRDWNFLTLEAQTASLGRRFQYAIIPYMNRRIWHKSLAWIGSINWKGCNLELRCKDAFFLTSSSKSKQHFSGANRRTHRKINPSMAMLRLKLKGATL